MKCGTGKLTGDERGAGMSTRIMMCEWVVGGTRGRRLPVLSALLSTRAAASARADADGGLAWARELLAL